MTQPEALAIVLALVDWDQAEECVREQVQYDDAVWFTEHPSALSADHPDVAKFRQAVQVLRDSVREASA